MSQFEAVSSDDDGPARRAADGAVSPVDGPVAQPWHSGLPGPELAAVLAESVDDDALGGLSDFDLVELVAAAQRMASWAHHVAATGAAELSKRDSMRPTIAHEVSGTLTPDRIAGEEISLRLGWSARTGQNLVREGRGYLRDLAPTGDALRRGEIDPSKARAIGKALDGVPAQLAIGVQDAVLPKAPRRTSNQLANDVRNALVAIDPAEATERSKRAENQRYVSKPKALPDGMAGLWLTTTAVEATALYQSIDDAARRARRRGDTRTLDQLRADFLVARGLHDARCADPHANNGRKGPKATCSTAVNVDVRVLVPLSTLIGTEDEPGHLEGYGSIDPEVARAWARGGTWRRLVTDPYSGAVLDVGRTRYSPPSDLAEHVRFRDLTCVRPGCGASAWRSELDHTIAFHRNPALGGPTAARNLAPLSKGCHQVKTHAGFNVKRLRAGTYRWTTPTGHYYDHETPPPLRGVVAHEQMFRLRHELDELSPPDPPERHGGPGAPGRHPRGEDTTYPPRPRGPATPDADPGPPPF